MSPEPRSPALVGQRIGRFHITRRIGRGGGSTVFQAYDAVAARDVAVKVMLPGADAVARQRFRNETDIASRLQHPNIVQTYQVGEFAEHDVGYIAMELVYGDTLADLVRKTHQISFVEACCLLAPIAQALAYAHAEKLVHRDVKPSNILLRPATVQDEHHILIASLDYPFVPLLTDFGIAWARDMPDITAAGRTVGSPAYMSPEQCAGALPVDHRTDIYALGLVLYRCIVGKELFVGTTAEVLYKHAHVEFDEDNADLQQVTLPAELRTLLRQCLAKDPDARMQSASELGTELDVIGASANIDPAELGQSGDPISVTQTMPQLDTSPWLEKSASDPPAASRRDARGLRGRPGTLAAGLAALALVIAGLVVSRSAVDWPRYLSALVPSAEPAAATPVPTAEPVLSMGPTPELDNPPAVPMLPPPVSPTAQSYAYVNAAQGVNVRTGPGTEYPRVETRRFQERLSITGRDASGQWWEIDLSASLGQEGARGWVYGGVITEPNVQSVRPVRRVSPMPTPVILPTATSPVPSPTAAPRATEVPSFRVICRDFGPHPGFTELFEEFDGYEEFGCQSSISQTGPMIFQTFQWGDLFFLLDDNRVYVALVNDDTVNRRPAIAGAVTTFFRYHQWASVFVRPSDLAPPTPQASPTPEVEAPADALEDFFGYFLTRQAALTADRKVSLQDQLGAPLAPPQRVTGAIQSFAKGTLIWVEPDAEEAFIAQLGKLERIDVQ